MFKNIKIRAKITGLIVTLVAVVALAFAILTYQVNVKAERDKLNLSITAIADEQATMLNYFFDHAATTAKFLQNSSQMKAELAAGPDTVNATLRSIKEIYSFSDVYLTDKNGTVLATTDTIESKKGHILSNLDKSFFDRTNASLQYSAVRKSGENYF
ncbi:MAG TPA: hypothetical protein VN457_07790, partial [Chlamydiales bacterium]|nr:hypothetical protein [Chlamydiales bacterium]